MKKIYTFLSYLLITSTLLSACGGNASTQVTKSSLKREKSPSVANEDLKTLVDGNNTFALDIYQSLHSENGNLILSPFSMSLALAMTYAGARGNTESQMADVLHFTQGQEKTHPAFNSLDLALENDPINLDKDQEPLKLNIANAVWAEQTFSFLPEFLDTIALNYGAGVQLADFVNNFENERVGINNWVSDKTEDRINDLLPDGSLNADTRMVLVNAIYFKADWSTQFDANSTHDAAFHLLDGTEITTPTMNDVRFGIPYVQGDGYQAVELSYAGETAAMDIILPDEGNFEAFESSFNKDLYDEILQGMQPSNSITLSLPKFEFTKDFGLAAALSDLGMKDAFDRGAADFSGMTGKRDLFISDVIHKAFVAVDEEGTEAAAATAVIMEAAGAMMPETSFIADHPFLFIIRDTVNGQILFIGRVLNPSE
jgi:serpin B